MAEKNDEFKLRIADKSFDIILKTVEYSCWATYVQFSDSPEYTERHNEMRNHLKLVAGLPTYIQKNMTLHISRIMQTLHMSTRDYESALKEVMQNDPEGRSIVMGALEAIAQTFQDKGFGVLPRDFIDK